VTSWADVPPVAPRNEARVRSETQGARRSDSWGAAKNREIAVPLCGDTPIFFNLHPNELEDGSLVRPDDPIFAHDHEIYLQISPDHALRSLHERAARSLRSHGCALGHRRPRCPDPAFPMPAISWALAEHSASPRTDWGALESDKDSQNGGGWRSRMPIVATMSPRWADPSLLRSPSSWRSDRLHG
jgi:hypothetical protein